MKNVLSIAVLFAGLPVNASVYHVGPEMPYEKPSEVAAVARDGDTIEIEAADYRGDVAVWTQNNLVLRGIGGRPHLIADGKAAEDKAIWVIKGDNTVVENIEFSGAEVSDENGAGIRLEGTNLTVRNCLFHDNENGILTGPNSKSEILVEYSEFGNNGYGDGYSHNIYVGRVAKFTLRFSYLHHARTGHQIKSRAEANYIMFNRLADERSGNSSYSVDLPNPGYAQIVGNEIQQGPQAENWAMVHSAQTLDLINNTLVNDRGSGIFVVLSGGDGKSVLMNNIFLGNGRIDAPGAVARNNLVTDQAGLVDRSGFDYRLLPESPAIDAGAEVDASIMPRWEYVHAASGRERLEQGPVDVGAHAFESVR